VAPKDRVPKSGPRHSLAFFSTIVGEKRSGTRANTDIHRDRLEQEAPVAVDISREAQIRDIQETFPSSLAPVDLLTYTHPLKLGLRAVSTYDVFADPETASNLYDILRFAERPGERPLEQEDPRLTSGILRPMKAEDEQFLAYFLPRNDEDAAEYMEQREIELQTGRLYDGNHARIPHIWYH
jgi:Paf1